MTSARLTRRSHPAARRLARAARLASASTPYMGTCPDMGVVDGRTDAEPRNLGLRATDRALAAEFVYTRPQYNSRGVRIG